jgi:hypothetical protein
MKPSYKACYSSKTCNHKELISKQVMEVTELISSNETIIKKKLFIQNEYLVEIRNEIINWLLFVFNKIYLINHSTYFMGINILDSFLETNQNKELIKKIRAIGLICLRIASKIIEVNCIGINLVSNFLDDLFKLEELTYLEQLIFTTLKFRIRNVYFEEFSFCILSLFDENLIVSGNSKYVLSDKFMKFHQSNLFLYKLLLRNYNLYRKKDIFIVYFSLIYFTLNNEMRLESSNFIKTYSHLLLGLADSFIPKKEIVKYALDIQNQYLNFLIQKNLNEDELYINDFSQLLIK